MHDHRFFVGMPGMGLMKGMNPDLMWMQGQGWMSMARLPPLLHAALGGRG